jgi:hypothetical protein
VYLRKVRNWPRAASRELGVSVSPTSATQDPKVRLYSAIALSTASMAVGAVPFVTDGLTRGVSRTHHASLSALTVVLGSHGDHRGDDRTTANRTTRGDAGAGLAPVSRRAEHLIERDRFETSRLDQFFDHR